MARKNLNTVQPIELTVEHDVPMSSSLQIAKHFGKQHNNVLRDIKNLLGDLPEDWGALNFEPMFITVEIANNAKREDPAYMITRDGFAMLGMIFNGRKAAEWKIKYIEAFNAMERALQKKALEQIQIANHVLNHVTPPPLEDAEKMRQRQIKVLRGFLTEWAVLDNIPMEATEMSFCAYMQIKNVDAFDGTDENYKKATNFLYKAIGSLAGKGDTMTEEQAKMIGYLTEACEQFRFTRDMDATNYLAEVYSMDIKENKEITSKDADKILKRLGTLMHEMMRISIVLSSINNTLFSIKK